MQAPVVHAHQRSALLHDVQLEPLVVQGVRRVSDHGLDQIVQRLPIGELTPARRLSVEHVDVSAPHLPAEAAVVRPPRARPAYVLSVKCRDPLIRRFVHHGICQVLQLFVRRHWVVGSAREHPLNGHAQGEHVGLLRGRMRGVIATLRRSVLRRVQLRPRGAARGHGRRAAAPLLLGGLEVAEHREVALAHQPVGGLQVAVRDAVRVDVRY
mmetsp:Transcript_117890/g.345387  ORF Transcript_117890/g.345387 Transcript_117890/m.345387 type:complete len:211 (-) Transcript_117890:1319-1951(-)